MNKSIISKSIVAKVKAELLKDNVESAKNKLKSLYVQRNNAKKVLKNVEREIEDYLEEIEQDESDLSS